MHSNTYCVCVRATTDAAPAIRLRIDRFLGVARKQGWTTAAEISQALGISAGNLSRLFNRDHPQQPGTTFIAAVLAAFPQHKFEDFFEVTGRTPGRTDAA